MNHGVMKRLACSISVVVVLGSTLSACVGPLLVGGAMVGGSLVAVDRRTSGTQLDDEGIELRAGNQISSNLGTRVRVSVTSYNRQVLLTGEVPNAQDKQRAGQLVAGVGNVTGVVNELQVLNTPSLADRSADALVTGRVKAMLLDARDLKSNAFKVVTERGTTYLMGRVTQRESDRATEVVRAVPGVQKVVRLFEIISEQELERLQSAPAGAPAEVSKP
ncbi:MAG: BON domain-containing protein [Polaromonas sp.]